MNGKPVTCLNAFLADLRENRTLRTNAVARETNGGVVTVRRAALRVDLHYLISAWHSADDSDQVPATMFEHALLSRVVAAMSFTRLNSDLLLSAAQVAGIPEVMRSIDLPVELLPIEGFPRLGEFWTSMGQGRPWRPACYVVVTMPVAPEPHEGGGIVETILTDLSDTVGPYASPLPDAGVLAFGGVVSSPNGPVAGAVVALHGRPGGPAAGCRDLTRSGADGRFSFAGLPPGSYDVVFSHPSHPNQPAVPVTVPLATGHVDLAFP